MQIRLASVWLLLIGCLLYTTAEDTPSLDLSIIVNVDKVQTEHLAGCLMALDRAIVHHTTSRTVFCFPSLPPTYTQSQMAHYRVKLFWFPWKVEPVGTNQPE